MTDISFDPSQATLPDYYVLGEYSPSHPATLIDDRDEDEPDLDRLEKDAQRLPTMTADESWDFVKEVDDAYDYIHTYWTDNLDARMRVEALAQTADEELDRRDEGEGEEVL